MCLRNWLAFSIQVTPSPACNRSPLPPLPLAVPLSSPALDCSCTHAEGPDTTVCLHPSEIGSSTSLPSATADSSPGEKVTGRLPKVFVPPSVCVCVCVETVQGMKSSLCLHCPLPLGCNFLLVFRTPAKEPQLNRNSRKGDSSIHTRRKKRAEAQSLGLCADESRFSGNRAAGLGSAGAPRPAARAVTFQAQVTLVGTVLQLRAEARASPGRAHPSKKSWCTRGV